MCLIAVSPETVVIDVRTAALQDLIDAVLIICGTPEQCYRQITDFIEYTGGMGNLLVITQGGSLDHNDTVDSLTLLAREIMPRLRDYEQPKARRTAAA